KSFWHPLNEDGERRIHIAAVIWVGIAHLRAVCGMQWLVARYPVECLARAVVGIDQKRRRAALRAVFHRHQVRTIARGRSALDLGDRMGIARIVFAKDSAEELAERIVERVQPNHRRWAEMAVVVPGPAGGENEVSGIHRNALALDRGVGAFALDDET